MSDFKEQRIERLRMRQQALSVAKASTQSSADSNKIETLSVEEERVREQYEKEVAEALASQKINLSLADAAKNEDDVSV